MIIFFLKDSLILTTIIYTFPEVPFFNLTHNIWLDMTLLIVCVLCTEKWVMLKIIKKLSWL